MLIPIKEYWLLGAVATGCLHYNCSESWPLPVFPTLAGLAGNLKHLKHMTAVASCLHMCMALTINFQHH